MNGSSRIATERQTLLARLTPMLPRQRGIGQNGSMNPRFVVLV